jgi:hypothetical protein
LSRNGGDSGVSGWGRDIVHLGVDGCVAGDHWVSWLKSRMDPDVVIKG